jgi:hypothetical protein
MTQISPWTPSRPITTLLYHTGTTRIRRNFPYLTSVSFDMQPGNQCALQGRRCPDGARGYVGLSHTCAGVSRSVAAELKLESARIGDISNHIFSRANKRRSRSFFYFGEHKTTETTKVLTESDVYFSSPPEPAQLIATRRRRSSTH